MEKEIIVPQKGSKQYNGLLDIFGDDDVLDIALKEAVDVLSQIDYEFDFYNYYNVYYRYNELTGGYSRSPDSRPMLDKYTSSEDDLDFIIWFLLKTMPNRGVTEKEWAVKILKNRLSGTKYGDGKAQKYYKQLTGNSARERNEETPKGNGEDGAPTENELKRRAIKDEIMAMMEWKDADDVYIFKKREHWEGVYYVLKADGHYTGFACNFKKFIIDKLGIDLKSLRVELPAEKNQSRWLTYGNNISRDALKKQTEHTDIVDVGIRFAEELDTRLPQKDKKVPSE